MVEYKFKPGQIVFVTDLIGMPWSGRREEDYDECVGKTFTISEQLVAGEGTLAYKLLDCKRPNTMLFSEGSLRAVEERIEKIFTEPKKSKSEEGCCSSPVSIIILILNTPSVQGACCQGFWHGFICHLFSLM